MGEEPYENVEYCKMLDLFISGYRLPNPDQANEEM